MYLSHVSCFFQDKDTTGTDNSKQTTILSSLVQLQQRIRQIISARKGLTGETTNQLEAILYLFERMTRAGCEWVNEMT